MMGLPLSNVLPLSMVDYNSHGPATDPTPSSDGPSAIRVARLGDGGTSLAELRAAFRKRNPRHDLEGEPTLKELLANDSSRVVFVQGAGSVPAQLHSAGGKTCESELAVGDIVLVRPGERLELGSSIAALVFTVPDPLPGALPTFIRPDWDPRITDTPGGCAEQEGAYRRILLTWSEAVGPYTYHGLNAHRVRITDSFTHYHPPEGGFDEFYLVQLAPPGARVLVSEDVVGIEAPQQMTRGRAARVIRSLPLEVGDLVYLPRGTAHRGLGGALVQVITVPGFRPNAEIGLDHHLLEINRRLGLSGEDMLPYNTPASSGAVVK